MIILCTVNGLVKRYYCDSVISVECYKKKYIYYKMLVYYIRKALPCLMIRQACSTILTFNIVFYCIKYKKTILSSFLLAYLPILYLVLSIKYIL